MGQSYSSRKIIKLIQKDGWTLKNVEGDHYHFEHPTKPGITTVPHPVKDLPKGTANSILRQAGLK